MIRAATTGGAATGAYLAGRLTGTLSRARTMALVCLVGTQLGQTMLAGGRDPLVLASGIGSAAVLFAIVETPGKSQLFGCRPLGPIGLATASGYATASTVAAGLAPRPLRDVDVPSLDDLIHAFDPASWRRDSDRGRP